jgi:hypothetical protein
VFEGCDLFDYSEAVKGLTFEYIEELLDCMFEDEYFAMSTVVPVK